MPIGSRNQQPHLLSRSRSDLLVVSRQMTENKNLNNYKPIIIQPKKKKKTHKLIKSTIQHKKKKLQLVALRKTISKSIYHSLLLLMKLITIIKYISNLPVHSPNLQFLSKQLDSYYHLLPMLTSNPLISKTKRNLVTSENCRIKCFCIITLS